VSHQEQSSRGVPREMSQVSLPPGQAEIDPEPVACPLGCQERPRFQETRKRLRRFECASCGFVFEVGATPSEPRREARS